MVRFKERVEQRLADITQLVNDGFKDVHKSLLIIIKKTNKIMTSQEQFKEDVKAEFARIDASTDEIAQEFKDYADKIEAQGISAVDEQEILSMLRSRGDRLQGLGKNVPVDPGTVDPGTVDPGTVDPDESTESTDTGDVTTEETGS